MIRNMEPKDQPKMEPSEISKDQPIKKAPKKWYCSICSKEFSYRSKYYHTKSVVHTCNVLSPQKKQ
jgi:hypothetical protein